MPLLLLPVLTFSFFSLAHCISYSAAAGAGPSPSLLRFLFLRPVGHLARGVGSSMSQAPGKSIFFYLHLPSYSYCGVLLSLIELLDPLMRRYLLSIQVCDAVVV